MGSVQELHFLTKSENIQTEPTYSSKLSWVASVSGDLCLTCNKLWNCPASKTSVWAFVCFEDASDRSCTFSKRIFQRAALQSTQYNDNKGNSVLFYDSIQYSVFLTKAVINKCGWCRNTCSSAPTEICLCLAPAVVLSSAFRNISQPSNWKISLNLLCFVHLIQVDFCHRFKEEVIQLTLTV